MAPSNRTTLGATRQKDGLGFWPIKLREKNGRSRDFVPTKMAIYLYIYYIFIDIACCYLYE
jgi:hypothetical protein